MNLTGVLLFAIFLIGVLGQFFFVAGNHRQMKRRFYPWWLLVLSLLFFAAPFTSGAPAALVLLWAPAVAITGVMLKVTTRFCDNCGAMCRLIFGHAGYCQRCGARVVR